jgi:hypothetical protein
MILSFLFVTIGWHLWTASDKENIEKYTRTRIHTDTHTHTHTHTEKEKKRERNSSLASYQNEKKRKF